MSSLATASMIIAGISLLAVAFVHFFTTTEDKTQH